jgi:cell division protein FtsN
MHRYATLTLLLLPALAGAQSTPSASVPPDTALRVARESPRPATDSLFRRARRLVAEGHGTAGRVLVDSLLRVADPTTPAYGDALYWHGALAPTAAEAERDYRRVIVEYPLAYYADDALLAIAELEQARGDRAAALLHLQRFVKEHPSSPARGTAALNAARLAFEQRDATLGCSMIAAARTSVAVTDIELRNQVDYYGRQCPRSAVATTPPAVVAPTPPATVTTTPAPVSTMPEPVTPAPRPATTSAAPVAPSSAATTPGNRPAPIRRDTAPTRSAPPPTAATPTAPSPSVARGSLMYTIQVAAYDTRPAAEQLVRTLAARGVKARVSGASKPFRVRLDFYRTRKEAVEAAAALKARGIVGFVTEEVPPVRPTAP